MPTTPQVSIIGTIRTIRIPVVIVQIVKTINFVTFGTNTPPPFFHTIPTKHPIGGGDKIAINGVASFTSFWGF